MIERTRIYLYTTGMLSRLLSKSPAAKTPVTIVEIDPFTVHIKTHARARNLTLRYYGTKGYFVATKPKRVSQKETMQFLHAHVDWMHTQTRIAQQATPEKREGHILIADTWRRVKHTDGAGVHVALHDDALHVTCREARLPRAIQRFIRQHALDTISALAYEKAAQIDCKIDSITVRDTTSRWGSCSHDGRLSFSWRLIMAPPAVIDYVVAHEVAHLVHFDHSTEFWALCRTLSTHYTTGKHWLKLNGQSLHLMDV